VLLEGANRWTDNLCTPRWRGAAQWRRTLANRMRAPARPTGATQIQLRAAPGLSPASARRQPAVSQPSASRQPASARLGQSAHVLRLTGHVSPCLAMPRHASPCLAMPRHVSPCRPCLPHRFTLKKYMTDKHGMESKQAARRAAPKDGVLYRVGVCIGVLYRGAV
jgi:hypothetical protein